MKRYLVLFVTASCLLFANHGNAQDYNSAIGLRLGFPLSVTYKTFINENGAVEVFGGFRGYTGYSWVNIGGAYEVHNSLEDVAGLQWYYGAGASVFFWNFNNSFLGDSSTSTNFGVLGVLGLDYKFSDAPINVSLDWMPTFRFSGFDNGFVGGLGALSVRYTLN